MRSSQVAEAAAALSAGAITQELIVEKFGESFLVEVLGFAGGIGVKRLRNALDADQDSVYVRITHADARFLITALTAQPAGEPVAQVVGSPEALPFRKIAWLRQDLPIGAELYTAPQSDVREGMLRAAEICQKRCNDWVRGATNSELTIRSNEAAECREAITRAAEQINAEGQELAGRTDKERISGAVGGAEQPATQPVPSAPHAEQTEFGPVTEAELDGALVKIASEQTVRVSVGCSHDWRIWPETDGYEQRCSKCGTYRNTPREVRDSVIRAAKESGHE